ncbi:MAG: PAS domain-containing protein [Thalassobaculaceae bacterium]|nr:PAS domain-containing protein [Thalassobaculaceae bacterium]
MVDLEERPLWLTLGDSGETLEDIDLQHVFAYWRRAAGSGSAPRRQDIDPPLQLPKFLPTTILFDVVRDAAGRFMTLRYRLIGTQLVEYAGRDPTGLTVEEAFGKEFKARDREIYDRVIGEQACFCGRRVSLVDRRQLFESYSRLVMPLLGDRSETVDIVWCWLKFDVMEDILP